MTAAGYAWQDVATMGGDELRSLEAWELASLMADALRQAFPGQDGYTPLHAGRAREAAERLAYYLDVKRCGETAAAAMLRAREELAY